MMQSQAASSWLPLQFHYYVFLRLYHGVHASVDLPTLFLHSFIPLGFV